MFIWKRISKVLTIAFTAVCGLTGCQTWEGGMTLPSPHYLKHPPQYFPKEPAFPLQREQAYQMETMGLLNPRNEDAPLGVAPIPAVAPAPR
ncbi:MAG: hypothetical protein R3B84_02070 [Zavarzinella sp.]